MITAVHELDKLHSTAVREARRLSIRIVGVTNAMLERGSPPRIAGPLLTESVPILRDAMLASHLVALKEAQRALSLSVLDDTLAALRRQVGGRVDYGKLRKEYQTAAFDVVKGVTDDVNAKLRKVVADLVARGAHVREGKAALRDALDSLGITQRSDYLLETIFRTQSQIAYGAGRWQADHDPDVWEILWGWEYSAVMDDRTRPSHAKLDGTRLPKDDPFWERFWPPNGYNCRCAAIPVFDSARRKSPPRGVEPDAGFDFNAGLVFAPRPTALAFDPEKHPHDPRTGRWVSLSTVKSTVDKVSQRAWERSLVEQSKHAVRVYTQMGPGSGSERHINDALKDAPKHIGTVYRGLHPEYDETGHIASMVPGAVITLNKLAMGTLKPSVAADFGPVMMVIKAKSAVLVGALSAETQEKDVFLAKGTKLRVMRVVENPRHDLKHLVAKVIYLEEA